MKQGVRTMNDIAIKANEMPAHIKKGSGLGNEGITAEHLQTPRVKQLQSSSNEVDPNHSDYLEGAKIGDFFNTVTNEIYGDEINVINVYFRDEYVVWKKREKGGGLVGTFASQVEAVDALKADGKDVEEHEITQTHSHTLIKIDGETGEIDKTPFIFDCASSKLRVSREWNTQIMRLGGDRFASVWTMSSAPTQNRTGKSFYNISVENEGWVNEEHYAFAKSVYETLPGVKASA